MSKTLIETAVERAAAAEPAVARSNRTTLTTSAPAGSSTPGYDRRPAAIMRPAGAGEVVYLVALAHEPDSAPALLDYR